MADPTDDHRRDDGDDGGEDTSAARAPAGRMARLERMLAPRPPAKPPTAKGGRATKWSVDRLDGRERLYCYVGAVVAVTFSLLIYVGESTQKNFHPAKNQFSPTTALVVGLVSGVLLALTTWIGRRALVGFVALFTFLGFQNSALIVGFPFLVLAGWLLYRSYKVQKEATATLRAERGGASGGARTPRAAASSGRSAAESRGAARKKGPAGPEGNKRYTPKKPPPKPIPAAKPSWRERRAARASD